jgi:hypothetical protein
MIAAVGLLAVEPVAANFFDDCRHGGVCHAIRVEGVSPASRAAEFRSVHRRRRLLARREPTTRGTASPHDWMARFAISGADVDMIVAAYINRLDIKR